MQTLIAPTTNHQNTFETGATNHLVNALILHTDSTSDLAKQRDKIFRQIDDALDTLGMQCKDIPDKQALHKNFNFLFARAKSSFLKEYPEEASEFKENEKDQILSEYKLLYVGRFLQWKKEQQRNALVHVPTNHSSISN